MKPVIRPVPNKRFASIVVLVLGMAVLLSLTNCSRQPSPQPVIVTKTPSATPDRPTSTPTSAPVKLSTGSLKDLAEVKQVGRGIAHDLAWSPDGQILAVGSSLGVDLYDGASFTQVGAIQTEQEVLHLVFSPNSSLLATTGEGGQVQVWEMPEKRLRLSFQSGASAVKAMQFSSDSSRLYLGGSNAPITVWDLEHGTLLASFPVDDQKVIALSLSEPGDRLFALTDQSLRVFDLLANKTLFEPIAVEAQGGFISADGRSVFSVQFKAQDTAMDLKQESYLRIYNAATGEMQAQQQLTKHSVAAFAIRTNREQLAVGGAEGLAVWNGEDHRVTLMDEDGPSNVQILAFHPAGTRLAVISKPGEKYPGGVGIWDVSSSKTKQLASLEGYHGELREVIFTPDGRLAALTDVEDTVLVLEGCISVWGKRR